MHDVYVLSTSESKSLMVREYVQSSIACCTVIIMSEKDVDSHLL